MNTFLTFQTAGTPKPNHNTTILPTPAVFDWYFFNAHRCTPWSQLLSLSNRLFTKHCGRYVTFQQRRKFNCNNCQRFPLGCTSPLTVAALDWLNPTERLISVTFANLIGESSERGGLLFTTRKYIVVLSDSTVMSLRTG